MALAISAAPAAYTIATVGSTSVTRSTTVTGYTSGYYYTAYLYLTGYSTPIVTNKVAGTGVAATGGVITFTSTTDTALLTALANASALSWYSKVEEFVTSTAWNNGTPVNQTATSATTAITISVRHSNLNVAAYDTNAGTTQSMSATYSEPSSHAGWRARIEYYLADSAGNGYPSSSPTIIQTGSGYSGTTAAVTTRADSLSELRNMSIAVPGLKLRAILYTGWQLTGGTTYFSGAADTDYDTVTTFTVPAIGTGTFTQERYDKIRYYDGAAWQKPSQMKVWNGAQWVDYGTAGSYNTNQIKSWYNSQWTTFTKQGSESYTYDTAAQGLTKNPSLIDDPYLIYTYSTTTVEVNRMAAEDGGFGAYASHLISTANNYGWAGTTAGNDGLNEIISLYWAQDGPRWINRLRFRTANTTYYRAAPRIIDVKFLRADGTWVLGDGTTTTDGTTWNTENTHYTKYSIATGTYTAALTYGGYFTINAQHPQGFVGIRMRVINNTTYKEITQSTRASGIDVDFGTITLTNTWT